MLHENLRQLFTAMVLAVSQREDVTRTTSPLVSMLPKPRVFKQYPRCNEGERIRRMSQILCGTHRVENGLARDGQLVSRPDGSIQVRRPY